jgi:hypothetical protein
LLSVILSRAARMTAAEFGRVDPLYLFSMILPNLWPRRHALCLKTLYISDNMRSSRHEGERRFLVHHS